MSSPPPQETSVPGVEKEKKESRPAWEKEARKEIAEEEVDGRWGGYVFNDETVTQQQKIAWMHTKEIGRHNLHERTLTTVPFPIGVLSPCSFLEFITNVWSFAPLFLEKAAEQDDALERMKLVASFIVSGLHRVCTLTKPLNPLLGETFQGKFLDGTMVLCEQVSHHPPVTLFTLEHPQKKYILSGSLGWSARLKRNSIHAIPNGECCVKFADGDKLFWNWPHVEVLGVFFGERVMSYSGLVEIVGKADMLKCFLEFNPDRRGGRYRNKKSKTPIDCVRGEIRVVEEDELSQVRALTVSEDKKEVKKIEKKEKQAAKKMAKERRKIEKDIKKGVYVDENLLSRLEGSWLRHLDFTDVDPWEAMPTTRYWDIESSAPSRVIPESKNLPSDSRNRDDVMHLMDGRVDEGERCKVAMEKEMRREETLRTPREE